MIEGLKLALLGPPILSYKQIVQGGSSLHVEHTYVCPVFA